MSGDQNLISFGEIQINNMDNSTFSAGGLNVANGWSSHSKENSVIKVNAHGVNLYKNVSIIYDSDVMDTYIDDRDLKITNGGTNSGYTNIDLEKVDVLNMYNNSGLFVGNSLINGMDSHEKENNAIGPIKGHENQSFYNTNIMDDRDVLDTPIYDNDFKWY